MEIKVVTIEGEDSIKKCVYGSSGIMLNNKYIISTANVFLPLFGDNFYQYSQSIEPGKLCPNFCLKESKDLKVIWKSNDNHDTYCVKKVDIFTVFSCENLKYTAEQTLQGWAVDTPENSKELTTILSLFFVLKIRSSGHTEDFKKCLSDWWDLTKNEYINKTDEIYVKSVPFGNRIFLDSYSRGIVSNIVGRNLCLIVSDCPTTPGSEGSPMYKFHSSIDVPIGMVISTSCWWRGDWTGLTLIVDIRSILLELLFHYQHKIELKNIPHHRLMASLETCLLQVYCGSKWGTAIIINTEDGILLTNSHVIENNYEIKLCCKNDTSVATLLYRTPHKETFDLAVLKCDVGFLKTNNLQAMRISQRSAYVGQEVFSAGFAIFSKNINCNASLSKGYIIQSSESMMKTTCCVNSGMSGGAVLDETGELLGVVVCNTKLQELVYPRFNMAIPYTILDGIIHEFLRSKDLSVLQKFCLDDPKLTSPWKYLEAKL